MKTLEFLKKLKSIEKLFFSISDLEKISGLKRASLKVTLGRLVKRELIARLSKGNFMLSENLDKLSQAANQLYDPSYLSFESALSYYGVLNQVPYTITFATSNRSKKITLAKTAIEYRQLKPDLFTGFSKQEGLFIASLEKALLDQLYLVSRGKAAISFEELYFKQVDKTKFFKMARIFPKYTQDLAENIMK